jgi:hypothetical protein
MKKISLLTIFVLLMIAAVSSCGKDGKNCSCGGDSKPIALKGTKWKLAGIMDTETCKLKELEPKDCERCYTLEFNTDSTAQGQSVLNEIGADLTQETIFVMTEIYDNHNGNVQLFYDAIGTITSCSVTETELKFCCNEGESYLLFRKQ